MNKFSLTRHTAPSMCRVCDGPLIMGGPIWNKPLHKIEFVKSLIESLRDFET